MSSFQTSISKLVCYLKSRFDLADSTTKFKDSLNWPNMFSVFRYVVKRLRLMGNHKKKVLGPENINECSQPIEAGSGWPWCDAINCQLHWAEWWNTFWFVHMGVCTWMVKIYFSNPSYSSPCMSSKSIHQGGKKTFSYLES